MLKLFSVLMLLFVMGSAQAHEDPLEIPWPKGEKVPCFCDNLAMPYDLCLKGIGAEECFKVVESKELECSNNIKPGTVILTDPPIYNCEDLKKKQSIEKRIAEIEAQLKEIEKILVTKIDIEKEPSNWKLMLDK
tara:strand:+ start:213 stop:614 length:402 start_codon:yes stop_codon:yes gene_type:complete